MTFLWTDRAVSELKRLCDLGWRYSAIAKELGDGCTKNMVIGKVQRLREKGLMRASTVSPPADDFCSAKFEIESNYTHAHLDCGNECKDQKTNEGKAQKRKAAAEPRPQKIVLPKQRPPLEVLFPAIMMISDPTAIPDYPRCKWPGTDIQTSPRFECTATCVFGKPYCHEHWAMSVAIRRRAA